MTLASLARNVLLLHPKRRCDLQHARRRGLRVTMARGRAGAGMKHAWLATLVAVALGACAEHGEKKVEENVYPKDYRASIMERVRVQVADPTDIRDAYVSEPTLRSYGNSVRYIACVRFNAKDEEGRYVGSKEFAAFFFSGGLTQIVDATRELCSNVAYQPFPELQKLCREVYCKS